MAEWAFTVKKVADELKVSPKAVYNWINRGKLAALRLPGGDYRIRWSDVAAFIDANYKPVEAADSCQDQNSENLAIASALEPRSGSSRGPTLSVVEPSPFRRGQQTATKRRFGATST